MEINNIPYWLKDPELIEIWTNLTPRQQLFIQRYIIHFNATLAAIEAGYSKNTARSQGQRMLTNVDIKQIIEYYQSIQLKNNQSEAEKLVQFLKDVTYADIAELYDKGDILLAINKIPINLRRAIAGVEFTHNQRGQIVTKIKLKDSTKTAELLGKHLGIFEKDNVQKKSDIEDALGVITKKADDILHNLGFAKE